MTRLHSPISNAGPPDGEAPVDRDELLRRRRLHLLLIGLGISVICHLSLLYFLAVQYRPGGDGRATQPASWEFAILQEEELSEFESTELDDLLSAEVADVEAASEQEPAADLEPAVPAAELEAAARGAMPTLGGAGGAELGGGGTMTAGGAGTSFFGVRSSGTRFAFIVDRSGSMGDDRKLEVARRELVNAISALPDFASFHVVLFESGVITPPFQREWSTATRASVARLIRWLSEIEAGGGTQPVPAFHLVFGLERRPDVVYFLTDGQIPGDTAAVVRELNGRGSKVVVNTIAFGDPASQEQLRAIARESGGAYRYVPSGRP